MKGNNNSPKSRNYCTRVLRGRVVKYNASGKENVPRSPAAVDKSAKSSSRMSAAISSQRTLSRKDFTNLEEIGRGGFSVVYRAYMPSRDVDCVLKFLHHATLLKLNAKLADIAQERSLVRRMDHINIPKLLGFYDTASTSVLVLEYCDKGDLYDYIYSVPKSRVESFPRTVRRNQDYTRQLVTAVDYFQKHTKHIHMDLKPENVLVTSRDIIKLTDFGCCIPMKSPRQVLSKHNGGTKPYRPPELLRRKREFDSTVDVWGIGCITFQMMAPKGEHPFFQGDLGSIMLSTDISAALVLMQNFKNGNCNVRCFDRMAETCKTFLRQTIGTEREQRPLVSKLLDTAFLTSTARVFSDTS